ncbi:TetR family transcriptional regulator C-terminal domain-containing protein [Pseudomonas solani]|uniref:TetR family transcriptional regulator C-terminal domain-containing protein n=1 Tax=Pseudomonas solani TaxID=2731552 RepID=UPI0035BE2FF0
MNTEVRFSRLEPEQRKALLVDATLVCLKRYGFQGASVRKICAEAGVSVGLINHHYEGKDALVAEAYLAVSGRVMGLLHCAVESAPAPARRRLSAFFQASFSPEMLDPQLLDAWLVFWGAVTRLESIRSIHDQSYGDYRNLLAGALALLADEEGWHAFDAGLAAISLSALLDGLWLESGLNPTTFTPHQGVLICEAWVDGLQAGAYRRFQGGTSAC